MLLSALRAPRTALCSSAATPLSSWAIPSAAVFFFAMGCVLLLSAASTLPDGCTERYASDGRLVLSNNQPFVPGHSGYSYGMVQQCYKVSNEPQRPRRTQRKWREEGNILLS